MALTSAERQKRYRETHKAKSATVTPAAPSPKTRNAPKRNGSGFSGVDEVIALLESMPQVKVGQYGYEQKDRSADFIATFSSEHGRRVLSQIVNICDPPNHIGDADKPGTLAFKAGMRRVINEIQRCFVISEPITTERQFDVDN